MEHFKNIVIIGLGLIGGSMALALKKSGYQGRLTGFDTSREALGEALAAGAVDVAAQSLEEALREGGLIIIAAPLKAYEQLFCNIAACDAPGRELVITDIGSVKLHVHNMAARYLPAAIPFIGGHPMSGSEKGGFKAASPNLFANAYYFLTPAGQQGRAVNALQEVIRRIGAFPVVVTPAEHDRIAAKISHVPHIMASLLANTLNDGVSAGYATFAGGGFRDTTRVAAGDPSLWQEILLYNRSEVLQALEAFEATLADVKKILRSAEQEKLTGFLQAAKRVRDGIPGHGRDYLPVIYNVNVDIDDRPGSMWQMTRILGEQGLNIHEIEVLHIRENARGAIRLGFVSKKEQAAAIKELTAHDFMVNCI